ncbi:proton-translocating NADH-quinone oxidoreductase,chain N [Fibrella aestuarina BUZ 2]|uniref:NADH-quinone oxidoreductase subunit N n=1 Tax=Fibrella aestuarina BUZ 2 TaxID=1166018 RepID=I0K2H4_9BACT|nr:NADH-quinone oxidoreductase subunit N [Fibrella aestuarina]CCG98327.1 proton-translocating NADH-quinone oxidoreductase,chain N [Fibrella aestuarina BUZ 2]
MSLTDQLQDILNSLGGFGPEAWLAFAFCALLIAELVLLRRSSELVTRQWLSAKTLVVLLVACGLSLMQESRGPLFQSLLFLDNQAVFFKIVVAVGAIGVVLWETGSQRTARRLPTEWYAILIGMVLGLFLLTMAVNLLAIYLAIELVSISSYLLTGLAADRKASEGGLKYLLFGAVSSAVMLYGMSLLYGLTGTLDITSTVFGIELAKNGTVALVALLLTTAGVLFKLSAVPFHIWTPDAYEAAPIPVAAFFSIGPKAAALLVLMRLLTALPIGDVQTPLAVVALAGILIGNLSALRQTDAKRLLAYSTIAQAGFLLVGVIALSEAGFDAATFYAATYLFITLAAFFLIDALAPASAATSGSFRIADFAGRYKASPILAIALVVVALALTGLPPTVGFTAKYLSFTALFGAYQTTGNPWLLWLFGLGLANAVISLFYYLKIPFLLFFRPPVANVPGADVPVRLVALQWVALALMLPPVVLLFLKPDWLLQVIASL